MTSFFNFDNFFRWFQVRSLTLNCITLLNFCFVVFENFETYRFLTSILSMLIPLYSFLNCLTPTFIASTCQTQIIKHHITAEFKGVSILPIANHVHTLSEDPSTHILVRPSVVTINLSGKERFPSIACSDISTLLTWGWIYTERKQGRFHL